MQQLETRLKDKSSSRGVASSIDDVRAAIEVSTLPLGVKLLVGQTPRNRLFFPIPSLCLFVELSIMSYLMGMGRRRVRSALKLYVIMLLWRRRRLAHGSIQMVRDHPSLQFHTLLRR